MDFTCTHHSQPMLVCQWDEVHNSSPLSPQGEYSSGKQVHLYLSFLQESRYLPVLLQQLMLTHAFVMVELPEDLGKIRKSLFTNLLFQQPAEPCGYHYFSNSVQTVFQIMREENYKKISFQKKRERESQQGLFLYRQFNSPIFTICNLCVLLNLNSRTDNFQSM